MEKFLTQIKDFVMLKVPYYVHHAVVTFVVAVVLRLCGVPAFLSVEVPVTLYILREIYQYFTEAGDLRVKEGLPRADVKGALGSIAGGAVALLFI